MDTARDQKVADSPDCGRAAMHATPPFTDAQLHERACIICGESGLLVPDGHVKVDGLVWAVAAHPGHRRAAA